MKNDDKKTKLEVDMLSYVDISSIDCIKREQLSYY